MNYNICIDFGTCNTVISYMENDLIKQIQDDMTGDILIPTTIYFINTENKKKIDEFEFEIDYQIGNVANDLLKSNKDSKNYFFQFKRFLGITNKSINLHKDFLNKHNYEYITEEDLIYFYINNEIENKIKFSICDLIKLFFEGIKKLIFNKLCSLKQDDKIPIILTCPAYFHEIQRSQLKKTAELSGFEIFKLISEPVAAAIYYINKLSKLNKSDKYIIYDLGGGTIDTTVIEYHQDANLCEVIDIVGNNNLGGLDIDNILAFDILNRYSIDKSNINWFNKIKKYAEEIKIKLTIQNNYTIYLENVPINKINQISIVDNLKISYSRQLFNNLINDIIDEMLIPVKNMYNKYQISNIIFIGGPTQIPLLQEKIKSIININQLDLKNYSNDLVLYKTIVSQGGTLFFNKNILKEDFCLLDIMPMNIGINDDNNNLIIMIKKNSKIPITVEHCFTTSHDCQRTIDIEIYEGLFENCLLNTFIGLYKIVGIPPLPKGMILIKLKFNINNNGILNISINGIKNPNINYDKTFNFNLCQNIKIIPNILAKQLIKKFSLLLNEKK